VVADIHDRVYGTYAHRDSEKPQRASDGGSPEHAFYPQMSRILKRAGGLPKTIPRSTASPSLGGSFLRPTGFDASVPDRHTLRFLLVD
jgi:hypothetical protein